MSTYSSKVIFLGDSVPFGWGVNYEDSIPGAFEKINKKFTVINAAVPSYTIKQSVDKFIEELKDVKNINYIYISNFNEIKFGCIITFDHWWIKPFYDKNDESNTIYEGIEIGLWDYTVPSN